MSAVRYLIALPMRHWTSAASLRVVSRPELVVAASPAVWCNDVQSNLLMADTRSLVLGSLFERASSVPIKQLIPAKADLLSSGLEHLVEDYWGSYLALNFDQGHFQALRDPTGFMPCYFTETDDTTVLASDVDLLVRSGAAVHPVDWERLYEYLAEPGIRRSATCLAGLYELTPGVLANSLSGFRNGRVLWSPWRFTGRDCRIPSNEAADAVQSSVLSSIEGLASSYTNVVVGMSGGLDSSIVCASLARAGRSFAGLTMYTADPSGDERRYARLVAEKTGAVLLEHQYDALRIEPSKAVSRHLPRPVGRMFMQEIEHAYRHEIKAKGFDAIFTGNGGDNVFCYLHSAAPIVDRLRTAGERGGLLSTFLDMCAVTQCDMTAMAQATMTLLAQRSQPRRERDMRLLDRNREGGAPSAILTPYLLEEESNLPGKRAHIDLIVRIQNHVEGYDRRDMPPVIPALLAQPVVETCLRVASWDWCRGGINRAVAREAFSSELPPAIIARRSKSGPESLTAAIFELGRAGLREMLLGGRLRENGIIDAAAVEAAFDDPKVTRGQMLFRILELAEAEAWARSWS